MDFIAPMLVLITGALVIGSIFRTQIVSRRQREEAKAWADVQSKVIDKFGSADEVVRFLESESARRPRETGNGVGSPHARILDAVHTGILVTLGGIGLLLSKGAFSGRAPEMVQFVGTIATVVGLGYLASSVLSSYLMRRWGLLAKTDGADTSSSEQG